MTESSLALTDVVNQDQSAVDTTGPMKDILELFGEDVNEIQIIGN
jgi:hypothetical protein